MGQAQPGKESLTFKHLNVFFECHGSINFTIKNSASFNKYKTLLEVRQLNCNSVIIITAIIIIIIPQGCYIP